ncbi:hypothetical protein [Roseimaritima sediminicola]|uniref:hypothetical protein n=1 Tax=Roseimaritima sediminicola TaxID=2662066 RepID=UPI001298415B|nr:hypothetical protein [Roseimaritima sediminicola]
MSSPRLLPPLVVGCVLLVGHVLAGRPATAQPLPFVQNAQPRVPVDQFFWNVQLPTDARRIDGFTLACHTETPLGTGYQPVRLTARAPGRFAADRRLEVHFLPVTNRRDNTGVVRSRITCALELEQGKSSVSKDVYLPLYSLDSLYTIRVTERGRPLPGYQATVGIEGFNPGYGWMGNRVGVLLPREAIQGADQADQADQQDGGETEGGETEGGKTDGDETATLPWQRVPELDRLINFLGGSRNVAAPGRRGGIQSWADLHLQFLGANSGEHSLADWSPAQQELLLSGFPLLGCVLHEDQLWDNWLGYESLSVLMMPLPMLERLQAQQPAQAAAIRDFAAAGGTLYLYAVDDAEHVHRVLGTRALDSAAADSVLARARRDRRLFSTGAGAADFFLHPYVAGMLVCVQDPYPFPGTGSHWNAVTTANLSSSRALVRRGVDPAYGDIRFWQWVLPNVAKPPVYAFLTLLGMFTVVVGPVAYRITSKLKRLYLMLLVAPVFAVLTTLLMLGYGVLSDGIGYQTRVREVTWVDTTSGAGLRWTRATYFAGIRPADGLRFDGQTAVYPYPQPDLDASGPSETQTFAGRIVLEDDTQQLAYGFLPSRQQRQFIGFRPKADLGGIQVAGPRPDDAQQRDVRNDFDFALRTLLFRDVQGRYWLVEKIAAGQKASGRRLADLEAARMLRETYSEYVLEYPVGFDRPRNRRRWGNSEMDLVSEATLTLPQPYRGHTEGVVEQRLRAMLQVDGQIPHGHYFALADVTRDVLALDARIQEDSVHFCFGRWE